MKYIALHTMCLISLCAVGAASVNSKVGEPIAFIGHGAIFSGSGEEIVPSIKFVRVALDWYRAALLEKAEPSVRNTYLKLEKRLSSTLAVNGQSRLVVDVRLLDWLIRNVNWSQKDRVHGKLKLLRSVLHYRLTNEAKTTSPRNERAVFRLEDGIKKRLRDDPVLGTTQARPMLVTESRGEAYRQLCSAHGVPLPPSFGPGSPWLSQGIIDEAALFIVREYKAEVLTYESQAPAGMCIALPRFDKDDLVRAAGVICLGQSDPLDSNRPKACFWDNQDPNIPIDDEELYQIRYQRGAAQDITRFAGGSDLRSGAGGVCSDCHAGENPFVIHGAVLDSLERKGLPTFANAWYEPIVRSSDEDPWPQNPAPSQDVPEACASCHDKGDAGRLPQISTESPGYCSAVLRSALGARLPPTSPPTKGQPPVAPPPSMPPRRPGSWACTPNLPPGDVRYRKCDESHTVLCTPPPPRADDPRKGDPTYDVKCTESLAALLRRCDEGPPQSQSLRTELLRKVDRSKPRNPKVEFGGPAAR